jgi:hypothetical protein
LSRAYEPAAPGADLPGADALIAAVAGCDGVQARGDDGARPRRALEAHTNLPVLPGHKNRKGVVLYDKAVSKRRRRLAMFLGSIKDNRRRVVRYEQLDATVLGCIAIAILKAFSL